MDRERRGEFARGMIPRRRSSMVYNPTDPNIFVSYMHDNPGQVK